MPAVDRASCGSGTFELLWRDDVPDAVVISEAVALARVAVDRRLAGVRQRPARSPARAQAERCSPPAAGGLASDHCPARRARQTSPSHGRDDQQGRPRRSQPDPACRWTTTTGYHVVQTLNCRPPGSRAARTDGLDADRRRAERGGDRHPTVVLARPRVTQDARPGPEKIISSRPAGSRRTPPPPVKVSTRSCTARYPRHRRPRHEPMRVLPANLGGGRNSHRTRTGEYNRAARTIRRSTCRPGSSANNRQALALRPRGLSDLRRGTALHRGPVAEVPRFQPTRTATAAAPPALRGRRPVGGTPSTPASHRPINAMATSHVRTGMIKGARAQPASYLPSAGEQDEPQRQPQGVRPVSPELGSTPRSTSAVPKARSSEPSAAPAEDSLEGAQHDRHVRRRGEATKAAATPRPARRLGRSIRGARSSAPRRAGCPCCGWRRPVARAPALSYRPFGGSRPAPVRSHVPLCTNCQAGHAAATASSFCAAPPVSRPGRPRPASAPRRSARCGGGKPLPRPGPVGSGLRARGCRAGLSGFQPVFLAPW